MESEEQKTKHAETPAWWRVWLLSATGASIGVIPGIVWFLNAYAHRYEWSEHGGGIFCGVAALFYTAFGLIIGAFTGTLYGIVSKRKWRSKKAWLSWIGVCIGFVTGVFIGSIFEGVFGNTWAIIAICYISGCIGAFMIPYLVMKS